MNELKMKKETKGKSDLTNYRVYLGKLEINKEKFQEIFDYEKEDFIKAGEGNQKALKSFLNDFHKLYHDDGDLVCKDRLSGDSVTITIHHKRCSLRYKLSALKAGFIYASLVSFDVCRNLHACLCPLKIQPEEVEQITPEMQGIQPEEVEQITPEMQGIQPEEVQQITPEMQGLGSQKEMPLSEIDNSFLTLPPNIINLEEVCLFESPKPAAKSDQVNPFKRSAGCDENNPTATKKANLGPEDNITQILTRKRKSLEDLKMNHRTSI